MMVSPWPSRASSIEFEIISNSKEVYWTWVEVEHVYDGNVHYPTAYYYNVQNQKVWLSVELKDSDNDGTPDTNGVVANVAHTYVAKFRNGEEVYYLIH